MPPPMRSPGRPDPGAGPNRALKPMRRRSPTIIQAAIDRSRDQAFERQRWPSRVRQTVAHGRQARYPRFASGRTAHALLRPIRDRHASHRRLMPRIARSTWARSTWARSTWARSTWARSTWARSTWARSTWARSTWARSTWARSTWARAGWARPWLARSRRIRLRSRMPTIAVTASPWRLAGEDGPVHRPSTSPGQGCDQGSRPHAVWTFGLSGQALRPVPTARGTDSEGAGHSRAAASPPRLGRRRTISMARRCRVRCADAGHGVMLRSVP